MSRRQHTGVGEYMDMQKLRGCTRELCIIARLWLCAFATVLVLPDIAVECGIAYAYRLLRTIFMDSLHTFGIRAISKFHYCHDSTLQESL